MSRRRRRKVNQDEHHLYPTSRFPEFRSAVWNRRGMRRNRHVAWHILVDNKTPLEALVDLFYEFAPADPEKITYDPALERFRRLLMELPQQRREAADVECILPRLPKRPEVQAVSRRRARRIG